MSIYDKDPMELIVKVSEELKTLIKSPDWAMFVKTGPGKERPPTDTDWYYKRAAAVLRTIYMRGPIGVSRLRVKYGNKKNRGMKPERFRKAGGKIIRTILQQCDAAGFSEIIKPMQGIKKRAGRKLTEKGRKFLEEID